MNAWRLLDSGIQTASHHMALDACILDAVSSGLSPNTLRFLQFSPTAALIGFHQSLDHEIRTAFCSSEGIDVNRRITGGGAIVFEPSHIGWEIICRNDDFPGPPNRLAQFEYLCSPIIHTLRAYGLSAEFRPRNDIDINGRKISGTGGVEQGHAFLFQGTLLVSLDLPRMLRALRIPIEKLKHKEIDSFRDRITTLDEHLSPLPSASDLKARIAQSVSDHLGIPLTPSPLTPHEHALLSARLPYYSSDAWIRRVSYPDDRRRALHSVIRARGGVIRTALVVDLRSRTIQSCLLSGDFFSFPDRLVADLEAALKDCPADRPSVRSRLAAFFARPERLCPGLCASDFETAIGEALNKLDITSHAFSLEESNAIFPVNGRFADLVQRNFTTLLLPYCAKLVSCPLRYDEGCSVCGACTIGEGFHIAAETGLRAVSIQSFEHLMEALAQMKREGDGAFIGCCCEPFYVKHREDFERAGVPGILIDLDSTTCYDLDRAREARDGAFEGQTSMNLDLLRKVIRATG